MAVLDAIIIGAGPAGITAGIYAARKKMSFLILTGDIGGQALWSGGVENYTGWQFVSGAELVGKFEEHLKHFDIKVRESEEVKKAETSDGIIRVKTEKESYKSRTLIIASGKKSKELGVPGEKEFRNRGIQYCSTCDAPLFAGKDVAIAGGGNSALDAALQLVKIADTVHIINNTPGLHGDRVMLDKITGSKNLEIYNNAEIKEITGESMVEAVTVEKEGRRENIPVQGVFIEIGLTPNSKFIEEIKKNDKGEIIVNCLNETSVPGIYAAGDVTNVPEKQIIIAAGEGAKALLSAYGHSIRRPA